MDPIVPELRGSSTCHLLVWRLHAGVRLRTDAAKRMRVRENVLYLVFKLAVRLSPNWRGINAPNQLDLLLAGHRFVDGRLQLTQPSLEETTA